MNKREASNVSGNQLCFVSVAWRSETCEIGFREWQRDRRGDISEKGGTLAKIFFGACVTVFLETVLDTL